MARRLAEEPSTAVNDGACAAGLAVTGDTLATFGNDAVNLKSTVNVTNPTAQSMHVTQVLWLMSLKDESGSWSELRPVAARAWTTPKELRPGQTIAADFTLGFGSPVYTTGNMRIAGAEEVEGSVNDLCFSATVTL